MKYSLNWLQSHIDAPLPSLEQLKETIIFHAFEVEDVETVGADTVLDIKVLPDRAGDCLSHYGMARELAGLLKLPLKSLAYQSLPEQTLSFPVEIKSEDCHRYIAIEMNNVKVGPSPEWLKARLEAVGQRSINNIVDATNYVLLDLGQPTHAVDRAQVDGGITVRQAHDGESIITLSDEQKNLTEDMLVIADYVGALAIAGVKGGKTAEVADGTTSVVLEIANFEAARTRRTARSLGLQTDAAKRFENNLSPEIAGVAAAMLVSVISDVAGGTVVGVSDTYPAKPVSRTVSFTTSDITRVLGGTITHYAIEDVFEQYHYTYKKDGDHFEFTAPWWRSDITGAHDIAEEIGRVVGYGDMPASPLPFVPAVVPNDAFTKMAKVRSSLSAHGYSEVMTYAFRKKGDIEVARGPKGKSMLRTNLSEGLKESFGMNRLNAPLLGASEVKLFEIGTVFAVVKDEIVESIHVATVAGGIVQEKTLDEYYALHQPELDPIDLVPLMPTHVETFTGWSAYPFITRDIAVWVTDETTATLTTTVDAFAKEYCIRAPQLFDTFTKDGKTSVAYRFVFQSADRTLTTEEVDTTFAILTAQLKEKGFDIR